jgi:16S rRNA (cytosine967-C5)-methyltransferase
VARAGTGPVPSVRGLALDILARIEREGAYADILLDRTLRLADLPDPRDRALLTELVMGTLRRRGSLDHFLSPYLLRPLGKTDDVTRNALRLGAYQILHTRLPDRAVLFETVEAVKRSRGPAPAGFVNAVLRKVAAARDKVPQDSARLSAPPALVSALEASLEGEEAEEYLSACLEKPPFAVRANPFRVGREALLSRLAEAGAEPVPCRFAPEGLILGHPAPVHADPLFKEGAYLVMDEGAQLIAPLLLPREGEAVLDACAAPGGKTTHLCALAGGKARVTAADLSAGRKRMLEETVARAGAPGVSAVVHDFSRGPLPPEAGRFDKVLVDAPCTGMGVIRRNPDAKWRFVPEWPARMAALQGSILGNAWASLEEGGLLLYCTCSPLLEEDEEVVLAFLSRHREAEAVPPGPAWPGPADAVTPKGFVRLYPHRHGTDAFFAALLRKTA